ncbi:retrovirus-related pol polyprotein from transposon TNT 1-94 [Tanacetum coccineum]
MTSRVHRCSNYEVTCEDKAKRRNSGTKTKTFEENCYLLPYAVSSKEDTAYQRQLITRIRVMINSRSGVSLFTYTPYAQLVISQRYEVNCITRSSTKELLTPFENPEQVLRSRRKLFDTPSFVESNSSEFDRLSKIEEHIEEEVSEIMTEIIEQYMSKTRGEYRSGVARPKIDAKAQFELKGQILKELCDNTFSGSEHEDANEHIKKVLEIVNLFHILNITQDQIMLCAFPVSLTGAARRWLRIKPSGSITTWEVLKTKFLNKYCPPARTAKKMEEINNFQQEPDESLFRA